MKATYLFVLLVKYSYRMFQTQSADNAPCGEGSHHGSYAARDSHHRQLHGPGQVQRAYDGHVPHAADPRARAPGGLQSHI